MVKLVTNQIKSVPIEKFSEEELVKGLENGDDKIISFLYKRNIAAIRKMANQYPNMIFEADDVLQEGMTRMIMNVRIGKFQGKSSIHSYLYSICRNICFKQYAGVATVSMNDWVPELADAKDSDYFDLLNLVFEAKDQLDEKCVEIIDLRFRLKDKQASASTDNKLMDFEHIAELIGIKADNARQRFSRCLEKLIFTVKNAPGMDDLLTSGRYAN
ncbi:MAG: sigma-70 family RNA polymerase sigma factor [Alphaproteobacteria bacterium]|nr:sigma-70 family RNA polymerase sigma factor [Alphaproteobacteria bacterium]